jgi:hypothetical protein
VQVGQIIEEAPGEVFVVMRDAMGGGAYRGVRKAGVEGQWELARVERGVKKARTGVLRRGCVVVGVVFVLVPPPWV